VEEKNREKVRRKRERKGAMRLDCSLVVGGNGALAVRRPMIIRIHAILYILKLLGLKCAVNVNRD